MTRIVLEGGGDGGALALAEEEVRVDDDPVGHGDGRATEDALQVLRGLTGALGAQEDTHDRVGEVHVVVVAVLDILDRALGRGLGEGDLLAN